MSAVVRWFYLVPSKPEIVTPKGPSQDAGGNSWTDWSAGARCFEKVAGMQDVNENSIDEECAARKTQVSAGRVVMDLVKADV